MLLNIQLNLITVMPLLEDLNAVFSYNTLYWMKLLVGQSGFFWDEK